MCCCHRRVPAVSIPTARRTRSDDSQFELGGITSQLEQKEDKSHMPLTDLHDAHSTGGPGEIAISARNRLLRLRARDAVDAAAWIASLVSLQLQLGQEIGPKKRVGCGERETADMVRPGHAQCMRGACAVHARCMHACVAHTCVACMAHTWRMHEVHLEPGSKVAWHAMVGVPQARALVLRSSIWRESGRGQDYGQGAGRACDAAAGAASCTASAPAPAPAPAPALALAPALASASAPAQPQP